MQVGDQVQIRPSAALVSPWSGYARNGVLMRVSKVERRRDCNVARVKVRDPLSTRQGWFEPAELRPWIRSPSVATRDESGGKD